MNLSSCAPQELRFILVVLPLLTMTAAVALDKLLPRNSSFSPLSLNIRGAGTGVRTETKGKRRSKVRAQIQKDSESNVNCVYASDAIATKRSVDILIWFVDSHTLYCFIWKLSNIQYTSKLTWDDLTWLDLTWLDLTWLHHICMLNALIEHMNSQLFLVKMYCSVHIAFLLFFTSLFLIFLSLFFFYFYIFIFLFFYFLNLCRDIFSLKRKGPLFFIHLALIHDVEIKWVSLVQHSNLFTSCAELCYSIPKIII